MKKKLLALAFASLIISDIVDARGGGGHGGGGRGGGGRSGGRSGGGRSGGRGGHSGSRGGSHSRSRSSSHSRSHSGHGYGHGGRGYGRGGYGGWGYGGWGWGLGMFTMGTVITAAAVSSANRGVEQTYQDASDDARADILNSANENLNKLQENRDLIRKQYGYQSLEYKEANDAVKEQQDFMIRLRRS